MKSTGKTKIKSNQKNINLNPSINPRMVKKKLTAKSLFHCIAGRKKAGKER